VIAPSLTKQAIAPSLPKTSDRPFPHKTSDRPFPPKQAIALSLPKTAIAPPHFLKARSLKVALCDRTSSFSKTRSHFKYSPNLLY
jgi:hypothetical protein